MAQPQSHTEDHASSQLGKKQEQCHTEARTLWGDRTLPQLSCRAIVSSCGGSVHCLSHCPLGPCSPQASLSCDYRTEFKCIPIQHDTYKEVCDENVAPLIGVFLARREPWVPSPVPHILGLVVHAWYHLRDGKQEDDVEFEMNLGYKRPCLRNKTKPLFLLISSSRLVNHAILLSEKCSRGILS